MHDPQTQYAAAVRIVNTLRNNGHEAFFAGGWVRDFVMGISDRSDIDIATSALPDNIRRLFKRTVAIGEQFGVMLVVDGDMQFEVATFRADVGIKDGRHPESVVYTDAKNDALRRDFTINGMFYDPVINEVTDYVCGRNSISEKIIKAIGAPSERFKEDYLRMLRAVRFAARFGYDIEENTLDAIKHNAKYIKKVSAERIFAEMSKMLTGNNPDRSLSLLHDTELLAYILPEVENLRGVEQPEQFHPEGDVYAHTVKTLACLPTNPSPALAWSALLHDIGKPTTKIMSDRIRFNNHDRVGAHMSAKVLKRLRAPNALTDAVTAIVENHMNFMNVCKMRLSTLKKFLSRETICDELELHRADCLASHGILTNHAFIKEQLATFKANEIKPEPFITGKDLIRIGLTPGPMFGKILNEIYDLQLENRVTTKKEAMTAVRNIDIVKNILVHKPAPKPISVHTACLIILTCAILLSLCAQPPTREYNTENYGILDNHYQGVLFPEAYKNLTGTKVNYPGLWVAERNNFAGGILPDQIADNGFGGLYGWGDVDIYPHNIGLWLGKINFRRAHMDGYDEYDMPQRFDISDMSLRGAFWMTPHRNTGIFRGASAAFDVDNAYSYYGKVHEGHISKQRIHLTLTTMFNAGDNYYLRVGLYTNNNHITDPTDWFTDNTRLFKDGAFIGLSDNNLRTLELRTGNAFAVNYSDEKFDTVSMELRYSQGWAASRMRHILFTGIKIDAGVRIVSDIHPDAGSFQYLHYMQNMTSDGRMTYVRLTMPIIADIEAYRSLRAMVSITPHLLYTRINTEVRQYGLTVWMPEIAVSFRGIVGDHIDFAFKPSLRSEFGVKALEVRYQF